MIIHMYMTAQVKTVTVNTATAEIARIMVKSRIRRLVVVDESDVDSVVGIICHRDLLNHYPRGVNPFSVECVEAQFKLPSVADVMQTPVKTIEADAPLEEATKIMSQNHFGSLPVVRKNKLVGIITESDIFRAFAHLLSGGEGSCRVTFDITENEDTPIFLHNTTKALGLKLSSFITFHEGERHQAVAWVQGDQLDAFIEKIWDSGHSVVNILKD